MTARLKEQYENDFAGQLAEKFGISNCNAVPKLNKIIISMGIGDGHTDKARMETAAAQLGQIAGQKPVVTLSRKSISNFKLRDGLPVGLKVSLRRERMYEFLDRLVTLAIPRVKDFRGLNPNGFDGRGNYNMGLNEQSVFPEIDSATVTFNQGMNIAIQTSARTDEEARELLKLMGMPFSTN